MSKKKVDLRKEFPDLYNPSSKEGTIIDIPEMNFLMIDGKGDPNTSQEYKDAVGTLYACSFGLKMDFKKKAGGRDYVVPPLEGLWWVPNMEEFSIQKKDEWLWTSMIRVPDFVPESEVEKAIKMVKDNKREKAPSIDKLRFEKYNEGLCVQILYFGPYADEGPTIANLHQYARDNGYELRGKHHEIYFGDPRRTKPERLRTVIRQPIKKK